MDRCYHVICSDEVQTHLTIKADRVVVGVNDDYLYFYKKSEVVAIVNGWVCVTRDDA